MGLAQKVWNNDPLSGAMFHTLMIWYGQSALGQIDRAKATHDLVISLISLYSFADVGGDFGGAIENFEDAMMRIAVQTIECGIFIQQYTLNTGERLNILLDGIYFNA